MVYPLTLVRFTCCVLHHNNRCKQSVTTFPLYMEFSIDLKDSQDFVGYDLDFIHLITDYKQSVCLLFDKIIIRFLLFLVQQKISKRCRLENWFFLHTLFLENEEQPSEKNFRAMFLRLKRSPHAKIQLFLSTLKMAEKSRGHWKLWMIIAVNFPT